MPLVRYEIRNEHSLANPQLYRTAAKDDPEGLLEGVAMAGLVGIVRQLGDLAEFAAEVFRDLHEEVMATASRGHELLARVQQLEAEMPTVEKALLSETNQLRFAYTPGVYWHASIRNDQNHCTQGDLPRFIRSSYEECRGPPRLFLLDKFDVAGAGACLKRYTDPSFFRTEWASSELMKAERVQRDKRARREKKKGRRRRNVDGQESILAEQYQSRFSHELSRELSQPNKAHPRHVPEAQGLRQHVLKTVDITPDCPRESLDNFTDKPVATLSEVLTSSQGKFQTSVVDEDLSRKREETGSGICNKDDIALQTQQEAVKVVADDGGSECEQFLDALTTMESEADFDSESHLEPDRDIDAEKVGHTTQGQPVSHEDLKVPELETCADEKSTVLMEQSERLLSIDPSRQEMSLEPRVNNNGRDAKGASSLTTAMLSRRQSSESISSSSSKKAKHVQLLEEPQEGSRRSPEPDLLLKDEKRMIESFVQEPVLVKAHGVKVSKMVAAFESGSLEQVHVEVLEKERQTATVVSDAFGSVADAVSHPTLEPDKFGVSRNRLSQSNSRENSPRQLDANPADAGSKLFKSHEVSRMNEVKCTSPSSRVSVGSLDSPPDSPTFSALQSPLSPIRTERNILFSPDCHRMVFPAELLSAGSPTAVPVLASSPTSQEVRHPELFSLEGGHGEEEAVSLTSSSNSPVHLSLTSQSKNSSEVTSQPLTSEFIIEDSAPTLLSPTDDLSHLHSESPSRSVIDPLESIPSILLPEVVSTAPNSLEILEELHDVSGKRQDLVHTPAGECELKNTPASEVLGYSHEPILSPSESSNDDLSTSPGRNTNVLSHAMLEVEGKAQLEPILPTSLVLSSLFPHDSSAVVSNSNQDLPSISSVLHDLTLPTLSSVEHEKPSIPSTRSFETSEFYSEASFIPKAAHRRYPSLPLVEKIGQDLSHAIPSNSSRSTPESLLPSKAMSGAQLPAKVAVKSSSSSPMSRAVYDLPYPTVKAAHNRFHSFSSAEKAMLEVASTPLKPSEPPLTSSSHSRHVSDAQIPASKFLNELRSPSQTLSNLLAPTPPSKIERDFPPPPPPSSSTLLATKSSTVVDVQDGLLEAIASHDKSTLKKVKTMQNPTVRRGDERSHLLEQIRAQSFNLRHTVVEKVDSPLARPVTNINVAAILEKANAIRQAFAGSDEDDEDNDDWSDV